MPVNIEMVGENIPGSNKVVLDAVHRQSVHAQILREQRLAMPLHYVLRSKKTNNDIHYKVICD